jgi:uncharacterized integral membrane protein
MRWKPVTGFVLLLLVAIFILQNATVVSIQLLFWKLEVSRALMIFFVLGAGFVAGWLFSTLRRHPGK